MKRLWARFINWCNYSMDVELAPYRRIITRVPMSNQIDEDVQLECGHHAILRHHRITAISCQECLPKEKL